MAGLGKKTFTAGEVLTASDVNGYLMEQAVMVFGGTAARSSAIPSPSEGMMSYRTDDDVVEVFDGTEYVSVGGGVALLSDADISATTGSPGTATYSTGGTAYKTYAFTGSGSITLAKSGLVDCLLVGGGGAGGNNQGGGGGGSLIENQIYLPAGTHTITVGAGATANANGRVGNLSAIGLSTRTYLNVAYGGGNSFASGGCGGGSNGATFNYPSIDSNIGFQGGNSSSTNHAGGGGGIGGAAPNIATPSVGGAGGVGLNNSFTTGSNIGYGGGGGGGGFTTGGASGGFGATAGGSNGVTTGNGTANTGGGSGGSWAGTPGNGGSGLVAVRVLA